MIRAKNLQPGTVGWQNSRQAQIIFANGQAAYILAATQASAMTVGTALTLLETTCRNPHSIAFTSGGAQTSAFTFTIVGETQFGEQVTESVTTTAASAVDHSLYCYRRIISITPTAKSSGATDTVSIGTVITVTSGTPRVPLPCKISATGTVLYKAVLNAGAQPVLTAVGYPYYCLTVGTNPLLGNPVGVIVVHLDSDDPAV